MAALDCQPGDLLRSEPDEPAPAETATGGAGKGSRSPGLGQAHRV